MLAKFLGMAFLARKGCSRNVRSCRKGGEGFPERRVLVGFDKTLV
jgi:hypothetical protein